MQYIGQLIVECSWALGIGRQGWGSTSPLPALSLPRVWPSFDGSPSGFQGPDPPRSSALQHLTSFDARRERCGRRGFQRVLSSPLIPHPVLTGVVKMQAIVHRSHDFPHYTGKISGPVASWRAHLRAGNSEHPSHAGFIAYYQPESIRHFLYTLLLLKQPVRK